ncbi:MAG: hypothetical protein JST67_11755 [Bacteroidetes bacterium]|nr:hypothetical protein [Bacteroidota bacterium]
METNKEKKALAIPTEGNTPIAHLEKMLDIKKKRLENKKTKRDIENLLVEQATESSALLNEKIDVLLRCLTAEIIDEERTLLASEPFVVPVLSGRNRTAATAKLMELITKI